MIKIEPIALEKLKELLADINDPKAFFRLAVQGGGCSGFQYVFCFDDEIAEDDMDFTTDNLPVKVDSMSFQYLQDATVKYFEDFQGSYFTVDNPVATSSCGCGNSFSV
jgi:iron-sulfur cluster insertion protein